MTTWAAIFDRAAEYDVDVASVRETLAEHREDRRGAAGQPSDTDE